MSLIHNNCNNSTFQKHTNMWEEPSHSGGVFGVLQPPKLVVFGSLSTPSSIIGNACRCLIPMTTSPNSFFPLSPPLEFHNILFCFVFSSPKSWFLPNLSITILRFLIPWINEKPEQYCTKLSLRKMKKKIFPEKPILSS